VFFQHSFSAMENDKERRAPLRFTRCSLFVLLTISMLYFFSSAQQTPSQPRLTLSGLSDNVGPCQALLSALLHALKEERHFALLDGVAFSNRRLARNRFQVRTRSDPCISSVAPAIMITTSNSPAKGERAAQSITRCWTAHHGLVRAGPRVSLGLRPAKSHENWFE
jgi:hypothetical protein